MYHWLIKYMYNIVSHRNAQLVMYCCLKYSSIWVWRRQTILDYSTLTVKSKWWDLLYWISTMCWSCLTKRPNVGTGLVLWLYLSVRTFQLSHSPINLCFRWNVNCCVSLQHWLDPVKVIKKQVKSKWLTTAIRENLMVTSLAEGRFNFRFRVKLYPVSVTFLFEEATRYFTITVV